MTALRRKQWEVADLRRQAARVILGSLRRKNFPPTEEQILPDGLGSPEVDQLLLFSDVSKGFDTEV